MHGLRMNECLDFNLLGPDPGESATLPNLRAGGVQWKKIAGENKESPQVSPCWR